MASQIWNVARYGRGTALQHIDLTVDVEKVRDPGTFSEVGQVAG
jgi:hypothetical protein